MVFMEKKEESRKHESEKSSLECLQPFDASSMVLSEKRPIQGTLPCMRAMEICFLEETWPSSYSAVDPGGRRNDPRDAATDEQ